MDKSVVAQIQAPSMLPVWPGVRQVAFLFLTEDGLDFEEPRFISFLWRFAAFRCVSLAAGLVGQVLRGGQLLGRLRHLLAPGAAGREGLQLRRLGRALGRHAAVALGRCGTAPRGDALVRPLRGRGGAASAGAGRPSQPAPRAKAINMNA